MSRLITQPLIAAKRAARVASSHQNQTQSQLMDKVMPLLSNVSPKCLTTLMRRNYCIQIIYLLQHKNNNKKVNRLISTPSPQLRHQLNQTIQVSMSMSMTSKLKRKSSMRNSRKICHSEKKKRNSRTYKTNLQMMLTKLTSGSLILHHLINNLQSL